MSGAKVAAAGTNDDNEVVHDFSPLLKVYRSGRLERPLVLSFNLPGHDAATGVESKDVALSPFTFVRLYLPPEATGSSNDDGEKKKANKLPVVVYFHGGGFVLGSAGSCVYHRFVNDLVIASHAVAVSVNYRLAPEHMLPAAYEDSLAALKWVLSGMDTWVGKHGDLSRVFLVGDSAGGNICHHLAMHPDVKGVGGVKGIVLIHPWFWGKEPIGGEREHRRPWTKRLEAEGCRRKKHLWELVCPGAVDGVDDPRMNPLAPGAPELEGLACEKVMVCVAEGDHLRWRGKAYAEAVARAKKGGKPHMVVAPVELLANKTVACVNDGSGQPAVEMLESKGVGHAFFVLDPEKAEEAKELLSRIATFVSEK